LFFRASCCLSRTCLDADAAGREAIEKMLQLSERLNFPRTTCPFSIKQALDGLNKVKPIISDRRAGRAVRIVLGMSSSKGGFPPESSCLLHRTAAFIALRRRQTAIHL
jgi:hypothetical protein